MADSPPGQLSPDGWIKIGEIAPPGPCCLNVTTIRADENAVRCNCPTHKMAVNLFLNGGPPPDRLLAGAKEMFDLIKRIAFREIKPEDIRGAAIDLAATIDGREG